MDRPHFCSVRASCPTVHIIAPGGSPWTGLGNTDPDAEASWTSIHSRAPGSFNSVKPYPKHTPNLPLLTPSPFVSCDANSEWYFGADKKNLPSLACWITKRILCSPQCDDVQQQKNCTRHKNRTKYLTLKAKEGNEALDALGESRQFIKLLFKTEHKNYIIRYLNFIIVWQMLLCKVTYIFKKQGQAVPGETEWTQPCSRAQQWNRPISYQQPSNHSTAF